MNPLLKTLTPSELLSFVQARRNGRASFRILKAKSKGETVTVAGIARDLGLDKSSVLGKIEEELAK